MFHRVQQYELIAMDGRWFRPRVYGDRQPDGSWDGWLVFFPLVAHFVEHVGGAFRLLIFGRQRFGQGRSG